jgi:hypothetical protein
MMEQNVVVCKICNMQLKNTKALAAHMRRHKNSNNSNTNVSLNPQAASYNGIDFDTTVGAMRMLEEGHSPIEVMQRYKLDIPAMKGMLHDFLELKRFTRPERAMADVFLEVFKIFGERIRNVCDSYNDETGLCMEYSLFDIDEDLRRSFPGLFKGHAGKTRFHVGNHPWICAICRKGIRRGESL